MSYDSDKFPVELDALALPIQATDVFPVQREAGKAHKVALSALSELSGIAGETISAHKVLVLSSGVLLHADPTDTSHAGLIVGVSVSSGNIGEEIRYLQAGELSSGTFVSGARYYCGLDGALSTTPLAVGAAWRKSIGVAKSASVLVLSPGPTFKTA